MDSLKAKLNRVAPWRFVLFFVVLAIGGAFAICGFVDDRMKTSHRS